MYWNKNWFDFHPDHRDDLVKSGITYKTAVTHQVHTVPPRDISNLIKDPRITHMLAFPYFNIDGKSIRLTRYKLFQRTSCDCMNPGCELGKLGYLNKMRYFQPKGSTSFIYFTKYFLNICSQSLNNSVTLYITEGEKKALALTQNRKAACALSGVWNLSKEAMEALDALKVKNLVYLPDSDVLKRVNLAQSVFRLREGLSRINCKLEVGQWNPQINKNPKA